MKMKHIHLLGREKSPKWRLKNAAKRQRNKSKSTGALAGKTSPSRPLPWLVSATSPVWHGAKQIRLQGLLGRGAGPKTGWVHSHILGVFPPPATTLFAACLIDHACVNFLVSHFNFFFSSLWQDKDWGKKHTWYIHSYTTFIITCVLLRVSQHYGIQGILPSSHTNRTGKVLPWGIFSLTLPHDYLTPRFSFNIYTGWGMGYRVRKPVSLSLLPLYSLSLNGLAKSFYTVAVALSTEIWPCIWLGTRLPPFPGFAVRQMHVWVNFHQVLYCVWRNNVCMSSMI